MSPDKSRGGRVGGNHVIHTLSLAGMLLGRGAWGEEGKEGGGGGERKSGEDGWVKVIGVDVFTSQD